jgi:acetolactate synthase-1/2/3 large subunit
MVGKNADVTVVVCANRRHRILQTEVGRADIAQPRHKALALTDLTRAVIDRVTVAKGFGMPACSLGTDEDIADALSRALAERGPDTIKTVIGRCLGSLYGGFWGALDPSTSPAAMPVENP